MNDTVTTTNMPVYDPETDTYFLQWDEGSARSLSEMVIETVAVATRSDPRDLPPLYETIDPDALDRLFDPDDGDSPPSRKRRVSFRFDGCEVTVSPGVGVTVSPPEST